MNKETNAPTNAPRRGCYVVRHHSEATLLDNGYKEYTRLVDGDPVSIWVRLGPNLPHVAHAIDSSRAQDDQEPTSTIGD